MARALSPNARVRVRPESIGAFHRRTRTCTAALLLLSACTDRKVTQLEPVRSDTVVVNNMRPVSLPIRALGASGSEQSTRGVRWRWLSGDTMVVTDSGTVTCARRADARVEASIGAVRRELLVRCRPIQGLRFWGSGVSLRLHEGPQVYRLWPIGPEGEPVELLAGVAAIVDTSIAVLKDSLVYPRRRGVTGLDVRIGDCDKRLIVTVIESVDSLRGLLPEQEFVAPIQLVSGEFATWRFSTGLHEIQLFTDSAHQQTLRMGVLGANCARGRESAQQLHCVTTDTSVVMVRNLTPTTRRSTLTGTLRISRRPQPGVRTDRPYASGGALRRKPASTAADSVCPWILR